MDKLYIKKIKTNKICIHPCCSKKGTYKITACFYKEKVKAFFCQEHVVQILTESIGKVSKEEKQDA